MPERRIILVLALVGFVAAAGIWALQNNAPPTVAAAPGTQRAPSVDTAEPAERR
jgi:hypothetical protein